jgi:hypothetical protein
MTPQRNSLNRRREDVPFLNPVRDAGLPNRHHTAPVGRIFKDIVQREVPNLLVENCVLNPGNGQQIPLVIQATDNVYNGPANSTWKRVYIRNIGPWSLRLAGWTVNLSTNTKYWTTWDWVLFSLKWFVSCIGLACLVSSLTLFPD